jgi:hypothetical protein
MIHDRGYHKEMMEAMQDKRLPSGAIHGFDARPLEKRKQVTF